MLCVGQILHSVTDSRKAAIEDLCGESLLGAGKLLYAKECFMHLEFSMIDLRAAVPG